MAGILAVRHFASSSIADVITPCKVGFHRLCQGESPTRAATLRRRIEPHLRRGAASSCHRTSRRQGSPGNPARGSMSFGAAGSHQGRRSWSLVLGPRRHGASGLSSRVPSGTQRPRQSDGIVVPRCFSAARPLPAAIASPCRRSCRSSQGDKSRRDQGPERIVPRRFSRGCGRESRHPAGLSHPCARSAGRRESFLVVFLVRRRAPVVPR
jgi:hypothetical protein